MTMAVSSADVGIEELLHVRQTRVTGVLKKNPEDFVVREISAANEVVTLCAEDVDRVPNSDEHAAVLQRKLEEQSQKAQRNEKLVFDEPPSGWRHALVETIGEEKARDVEAVALEQRDECLIDAPTEFRDRVFVQVCVQNCFPGLDCKLRKLEGAEQATQIHVLLDPMYAKLRAAGMSRENCTQLLDYLRKGAGDANAARGVELEHEDSKDARTRLHRLIAKHSSCFKTRTETRGAVQKLVVLFSDRVTKKRKRSQPEVYLQFVLEKTNTEHFTCFEKLARDLKRPLSAFSYAGTKDKAAVTYQHVVVQGVQPAELLAVNSDREPGSAGIRVGHLQYVGAPMTLGSANGNRFTITMRDVACSSGDAKDAIASGVAATTREGFVNYFGFQRVGHPAHRVRPHHIGQQMLAGNWKEAVTLLLTPSDREPEPVAATKRAYLTTGDVDAALKQLPSHLVVERAVLQGLKRSGHDAFERAVENVPFARRLMFLHAYQSVVFNAMASARLRSFGAKLVAGDLVRDAESDAVVAITSEQAAELSARTAHPLALVLLPLAGSNVRFPANVIGDKYIELLEQHGTKAAVTESGPLKGSYRSLIAVPTDVEWSLEPDAPVLRTSFSLPSGAFATMCLREILQSDM